MTSSSINVHHRDMMFTTDVTIRQLTYMVAGTADAIRQSVHDIVLRVSFATDYLYLNTAFNILIVGIQTVVAQIYVECVTPVCCI
jgi:hypothetical protein